MRRSKTKDKLADLIDDAIDERLEEINAYALKHRLSYEVQIRIWKAGEQKPE